MDAKQRAAIQGAACAPLSRAQKREICMLAEKAWTAQGSPLWEPAQDPAIRLCRTSALELWRHMEQEHLLGRKHLTSCGQADFLLLKAHFARLAGFIGVAEAAEARIPGDDARRAQAALRKELWRARSQIADPRRYAETIALAKYKSGLGGLTAKQTWAVVFDLRRAAWARKKKADAAGAADAAAEKIPF